MYINKHFAFDTVTITIYIFRGQVHIHFVTLIGNLPIRFSTHPPTLLTAKEKNILQISFLGCTQNKNLELQPSSLPSESDVQMNFQILFKEFYPIEIRHSRF